MQRVFNNCAICNLIIITQNPQYKLMAYIFQKRVNREFENRDADISG